MSRILAFCFSMLALAVGTLSSGALAQESSAGQAPADTFRVTIKSAVSRALEVSPEVGEKEAVADYARARYSLARYSRFLTEFEATSQHSTYPAIDNPNNTPTDRLYLDPDVRNDWERLKPFTRIEVSALQPIWTWGELSGNIRAARAGVGVEEASVAEKEEEVAARTAELTYSVLLVEALSRLTDEAGNIVDRAKTEIQRLLDEGAEDVDEADMSQVKITEQEYIQRVVEVEQRLKTARSALRRQLFLPDGTPLSTGSAVLEPLQFDLEPLEVYEARALEHRAELDRVSAGLAAREALVDVAQSDYYPKFFVGANANYSFAADRYRQRNPYIGDPFLSRSLQIGFGIRQKLNFGQTRSKVQQAKAQLNEVNMQADGARQLIQFEVEEAYRNVIIAKAAMDARTAALLESKNWLRGEEVNFEYDLGDTENLVKAVQQNLELQAQEHQAVYNYNVAVIRLLQATGMASESIISGILVE